MPETISEVIPAECQAVVLRLWDYLDNQLDSETAAGLRIHIAVCPQCYEYFLFQESYLHAVSSLRRPRSAPWRVKARILASLANAGLATH